MHHLGAYTGTLGHDFVGYLRLKERKNALEDGQLGEHITYIFTCSFFSDHKFIQFPLFSFNYRSSCVFQNRFWTIFAIRIDYSTQLVVMSLCGWTKAFGSGSLAQQRCIISTSMASRWCGGRWTCWRWLGVFEVGRIIITLVINRILVDFLEQAYGHTLYRICEAILKTLISTTPTFGIVLNWWGCGFMLGFVKDGRCLPRFGWDMRCLVEE